MCVLEDPERIINTMNMLWAKTKKLWFNAQKGQEVFLFPIVFKRAVELNHPTEWVLRGFFPGGKVTRM
jgi:hypothetical protein